jgi:RND family efflux transporter MFP subunit
MAAEPDKKALLGQLRIDRGEQPVGRAPPRRAWRVGGAVTLIVLLGVGAWLTMSARGGVPVHTATAQPLPGNGAGASVLDATGYVTARREATVSAQITGKVTEVLFDEGDHVSAGQVIARLDDTAQRAALAQAHAQLQSARSVLNEDEAQLAQNVRDQARNEDLVKRNLVSQQALEQARTQVDTQTALVQSQREQIELAEANVRAAQVQLDYCTVHAPFAGVVIAKAAQVGEMVSPLSAGGGFTRTGIGTVVDMDSLEIEVDVNEAYINRVEPGQPVESVLNAYPDWRIPSHVIAIIPTADRSKATVKVRIGFDVKDTRVVPDMGVRVSFEEKAAPGTAAQRQQPRGVLVPAAAVRKDDGEDIVFVVKDARARRRAVTVGVGSADPRLVLAGLSAGEAVVVDSPVGLKDDAAVTEVKQ